MCVEWLKKEGVLIPPGTTLCRRHQGLMKNVLTKFPEQRDMVSLILIWILFKLHLQDYIPDEMPMDHNFDASDQNFPEDVHDKTASHSLLAVRNLSPEVCENQLINYQSMKGNRCRIATGPCYWGRSSSH